MEMLPGFRKNQGFVRKCHVKVPDKAEYLTDTTVGYNLPDKMRNVGLGGNEWEEMGKGAGMLGSKRSNPAKKEKL